MDATTQTAAPQEAATLESSPAVALKQNKRNEYLEYLMWALFVSALILGAVLGHSTVTQNVRLGIIVLVLEGCWIAGIVMMGIGFGLSFRNSGKMVTDIPKLWRTIRELKPNFVVWLGHWINFSAATLQGLVMIGAGILGPSSMRGALIAGLIDLALTFMRCIPMTFLMRNASRADKMYVTTATEADIPYYLAAQRLSWGSKMGAPEEAVVSRFKRYQEGIIVARKHNGIPVAFATTILLKEYDFDNPASWDKTTANGMCTTHEPDGQIMFGVDMSKTPEAPKDDDVYDILLLRCMARMFKQNLATACLGGRLPGYSTHASKLSADEYVFAKDEYGRHLDSQLRMYLSVPGVKAICAIADYFPDDIESLGYGVLLRWDNPVCSSTNRYWWRVLTSNQPVRNILAWMVPRAAAADMAYGEWRKKRRLQKRQREERRRSRQSSD